MHQILLYKVRPPVSCNNHCTISLTFNFKVAREMSYQCIMWNFKDTDLKAFRLALRNFDFDYCENDIYILHVRNGVMHF